MRGWKSARWMVNCASSINGSMNTLIIKQMVRVLRPALKDPDRAEQILTRFWQEKIAIVWNLQDVHTAANERQLALTGEEAVKVLHELHHHHNKQLGLRWGDVTCYIEEHALGRKMTQAEIQRFVKNNILTIQRERR